MVTVDWLAIEGEYRAGKKSVRAIAAEYDVSDKAIRNHAKKYGWERDPAGQQRERVKAHFAGSPQSSPQCGVRTIEAAADRAIALEELALQNAELALRHVHLSLSREELIDAADLKRLSETNKINLDVIRTIFTLNDPNQREGVGYDELPFPD